MRPGVRPLGPGTVPASRVQAVARSRRASTIGLSRQPVRLPGHGAHPRAISATPSSSTPGDVDRVITSVSQAETTLNANGVVQRNQHLRITDCASAGDWTQRGANPITGALLLTAGCERLAAPASNGWNARQAGHRSRRLLLDGSSSRRRHAPTRRSLLSWTSKAVPGGHDEARHRTAPLIGSGSGLGMRPLPWVRRRCAGCLNTRELLRTRP